MKEKNYIETTLKPRMETITYHYFGEPPKTEVRQLPGEFELDIDDVNQKKKDYEIKNRKPPLYIKVKLPKGFIKGMEIVQ